MTQKHVLHITYDMNIGGTEQVIRNLVSGLDPSVYRSSVLCIDGQIGPWGEQLQRAGVPHHKLTRRPGFDLRLIRHIRQLVIRENVDIVHAHQYTPFTYGWFGTVLTGKPVIFTEHGRFYPDVGSAKRRLINPLLQLRTAAITSISAATRQALVDYENFSATKIDVIYNGIADSTCAPDAALAAQLGFDPANIIMGTISRLDPIKNQTMLLRAFARCLQQYPHARLLLVGDGPSRVELEAMVDALGVRDAVVFTGFQPNPQRYLALMDVFLLPSLSEGTSMTLLEAMCFSKPSLATAVGGTPEIIEHEVSGLLTPNKDETALAEAMSRLVASEELRTALGCQARKNYEARFSVSAMAHQYEALYQRVS